MSITISKSFKSKNLLYQNFCSCITFIDNGYIIKIIFKDTNLE